MAGYDRHHPRPWERHGVSEEYYNRDRDRMWAWLKERRCLMAEQLKVTVDGEVVVLVAEGDAGTCEVRLKLDEAERFEEALDKARKRALRAVEARQSVEAMRVKDVEDDEEE